MIAPQWRFNAADAEVLDQVLDFLPERIFDAHAHIYRLEYLGKQSAPYAGGPQEVGIDGYYEACRQFYPGGRLKGAFFMAPPTAEEGMIDALNAFTVSELAAHPGECGMLLVSPRTDRALVERYLENPHVVGLKPFSWYSGVTPAHSAPLESYLPQWAWELADAHSLILMTHLVMDKGINDPGNYRYIQKMCGKYPRAVIQLDHVARGFYAQTVYEGLAHIRDLPGALVDVSSICDPMPMLFALKELGPERVLFASDFPLSVVRGKSLSIGTGFMWLDDSNTDFSTMPYGAPALIGMEGLRALMYACAALELTRAQVEQIFFGNAAGLIAKRQNRAAAV